MNKRVLVTGAAGFIGSHLVDALLNDGNWVLGLDSFTDDYAPVRKDRNIAPALQHPNFLLSKEDLVDVELRSLLQEHGIELIYHLAGQPGIHNQWTNRFESYVKNNIVATQQILEAALATERIPVVYASSYSVYGELSTLPISEEIAPTPLSPSGITKLAAEHLCALYSTVHALPTVALRLSNVYGPRQRPDMTFFRFLNAIRTDQEIVVCGNGSQTQDFVYVGDVVQAFQLASQFLLEDRKRGLGQVFNVTGKTRASILEILDIVAEVTSCRPRIRHVPAHPEDSHGVWVDCTGIQQALDFIPEVDLREGIRNQWLDMWSNDAEMETRTEAPIS